MLIEIEGIDGAGKTTQCSLLKSWLEKERIPFLLVKDISDMTPFSGLIRGALVSDVPRSERAEMFSFLACKADMYSTMVLPNMGNGKIVVADRGLGSFLSYHHAQLGFSLAELNNLASVATVGAKASTTILLDLPPAEVMRRKGDLASRFDSKGESFFTLQRNCLLDLASRDDNWIVIDAMLPIEPIHNRIVESVKRLLSD